MTAHAWTYRPRAVRRLLTDALPHVPADVAERVRAALARRDHPGLQAKPARRLLLAIAPHCPADLAERIRAELAPRPQGRRQETARRMRPSGDERAALRAALVAAYLAERSIRRAAAKVEHDGRPLGFGLARLLLLEAVDSGELDGLGRPGGRWE